ncbi:cupin domain-containing protein [Haloarcula sp. S1CR25-12]|uniref:Cupin domain-containing protein n=1 Tax=Haloarcula saliterrae TaxID=2950534 RepID=A0ABU2FAC6_9EURY|nr:cupin domain-containing protein [Haloarcula sp. S1CR25-12]MDS0258666.1 cupin domain-containing protein [Haloarcula sp. S1CR25-12]
MSYTQVNYEDVAPVGGGMHFMRDPLECTELGVTIVECEPGWTGKEHDHAGKSQEEVYVLVEGEATVQVGGDEIAMTAGDALRIDPDARRQIRNADSESLFVLVGAP